MDKISDVFDFTSLYEPDDGGSSEGPNCLESFFYQLYYIKILERLCIKLRTRSASLVLFLLKGLEHSVQYSDNFLINIKDTTLLFFF